MPNKPTKKKKMEKRDTDVPTWGNIFGLFIMGIVTPLACVSGFVITVLCFLYGSTLSSLLAALGTFLFWKAQRSWGPADPAEQ
jgi:hypothetical protein